MPNRLEFQPYNKIKRDNKWEEGAARRRDKNYASYKAVIDGLVESKLAHFS